MIKKFCALLGAFVVATAISICVADIIPVGLSSAFWQIDGSGNFIPKTTGVYNIGSATFAPVELFVSDGTRKGFFFADSGNTAISVGASSNNSINWYTNNLLRWQFVNDGTFAQNSSNGGNIEINKAGTYLRNTTTTASGAGTQLSDCTSLSRSINDITTVASGTGVCLPSAGNSGIEVMVKNSGANDLKLYPDSGSSQINAAGAGNPITLTTANKQIAWCFARASNVWLCTVSNAPNS